MLYEEFYLRPIRKDDLPVLLAWRNADHIREFMANDHIITEDEHRDWYGGVVTDDTVQELIFLYLAIPIGQLSISRIDEKNGTCYWGYSRGDDRAPKGSGTAMEYLALEHIFEVLKIRKLCGEVFPFNTRVLKVHSKFGWVEEGLLKSHRLKNGLFEDVICIAMFNDHWNRIKLEMRKTIFESE